MVLRYEAHSIEQDIAIAEVALAEGAALSALSPPIPPSVALAGFFTVGLTRAEARRDVVDCTD